MQMTTLLADLAFRGSFPRWLIFILAIAVFGSVVWFYSREALKLSPRRKAILAGCRVLTLWMILLLLMKPVWVSETEIPKPRPIAVVLDNSQSMTIKDPRLNLEDRVRLAIARDVRAPDAGLTTSSSSADLPTDRASRAETVRAVLANQRLQLQSKLAERSPLQFFLGGARLQSVPNSEADPWLNRFVADDTRTALADSTKQLLERDANDLPNAIFLITDGRDNASGMSFEELGRMAAQVNVPIHVYGVGGSSIGFLQLKELNLPETLFVDDLVRVPFRWRARGFNEGEVELSVTLNGKPVGTPKRIPVRDGEDLSESISFVPEKSDALPGRQDLVATIKMARGSEVYQDQLSRTVRIIDRKVKVLVVENEPRMEYKFLQRALLRDRRVDATFILINGDRKAMEAGLPFLPAFPNSRKDLFAFDMMVVGDIPAEYLSPEQRTWIRDFVTEGGGFVHVAGARNGPSTWLNTPLAEILPVEVPSVQFPIDSGERAEPYKPRLTELGKRSIMFTLADTAEENQQAWSQLPGWYWNYPITKLRPGAVSLLEHPEKKIEDRNMPLFAMHYYGKGLVLYAGSDETWRWRYNEGDKYFGRFWGQVIYQLGLPHTTGSKTAQLALDQGEAVQGKPSKVYARLFGPDYRPLTAEKIPARLERLDAGPADERFHPITLEAVPDQPGEYVATLPNDRQGRFALKVENGDESASLEYRVQLPPDHELAPLPMNEAALRQLAQLSGGTFSREEDLFGLPGKIEPRVINLSQRQELLLWTRWWVLALVIGLFTAEWLIRKFSNLS
jgi:uncharacterized membrane protein